MNEYNKPRASNGQFRKRRFLKGLFRTVLFVAILVALYVSSKQMNRSEQPLPEVSRKNNELEEVMNREEIKKQYELLAREVLLKEKKAKLEAEYKTQLDQLETELADVRSQKTSF